MPAEAGTTSAEAAAAQLDVDEAKHVSHDFADESDAHQHDWNADHGVRNHRDTTPSCLWRYVTVSCRILAEQ